MHITINKLKLFPFWN